MADPYLPGPGSNRGYAPSVFGDRLILMLQAGGRSLEDLRELRREAGLLPLLGRAVIPDPDTLGDWLRRMGDPQTGQAGLVGLGRGRDALTARLLRRDAHATYTLAADATFVGGKSATRTGATPASRARCRCGASSLRPRFAWSMSVGRGRCRRGPGNWSAPDTVVPASPWASGWRGTRAESAAYQAELINELAADQVRWGTCQVICVTD